MARSLFASNLAAAHRASISILGGANDAGGRQLILFWPADLSNRRTITESNYHRPPIPAIVGPTKRDAVTAAVLAVHPQRTLTFAAQASLFPAAVPPRKGVCFLAGPSFAEATFYQCTSANSVAGMVEIEATNEP